MKRSLIFVCFLLIFSCQSKKHLISNYRGNSYKVVSNHKDMSICPDYKRE